MEPFGAGELLARIRAALRRTARDGPEVPVLRVGVLELDVASHEVKKRGAAVHLTPTEFALLHLLMRHVGKVLTYGHILREVWSDRVGTKAHHVRVHMAQLRRKIEDEPARPRHLVTEIGVGYRFVDDGS